MVKFKNPILLGLKKTIAHSFPNSPVLFKQDKTEKYCSLDFKKQSSLIESFTNPVSFTQKYITVSIDLTKSQQLKRVKI